MLSVDAWPAKAALSGEGSVSWRGAGCESVAAGAAGWDGLLSTTDSALVDIFTGAFRAGSGALAAGPGDVFTSAFTGAFIALSGALAGALAREADTAWLVPRSSCSCAAAP